MCGSLEIECALEAVHDMSRQIDGFKEDAANGRLVLEAGETVSSHSIYVHMYVHKLSLCCVLPSSSSLSLLLPSLQLQSSALELGAAAKAVGSAMAQLLAAADQGNESYTGKASRETAKALQVRRGRLARNKSRMHQRTCTRTCTYTHIRILYMLICTYVHVHAHIAYVHKCTYVHTW